MTAELVTVSEMGHGVHTLQEQADILGQEIYEMRKRLQQLQSQILQKETQRNTCLLVAQAIINHQVNNPTHLVYRQF